MSAKAEIFQFLLSQIRNSDKALVGGQVYFYEVGTTTLKTVYTSRDKSVEAANPGTLDSNATLETYGDGLYRVVIKDTDGTTQFDFDCVETSYYSADFDEDFATAIADAEAAQAAAEAAQALAEAAAGAVNPPWVHSMYIPATAMIPVTSENPAVSSTKVGSVMVNTLDFDASTVERAQFHVAMPKSWDHTTTLTAKFFWSHAAASSFALIWGIRALALSDNDPVGSTAFGTAQTATDSGGTTNDLFVTPATAAMTPGGTPAAEDVLVFEVYRDATAGGDTLNVDARLHGVLITYTLDLTTDA